MFIGKRTTLSENSIYILVLVSLIIGAFGAQNFYILIPKLQIFRFSLLLSFIFMIFLIKKYKIYISNISKAIIIFFTIQYVWTTEVSIFLTTINVDNFFNFTVLLLFIINLVFLMEYNKELFIETFLKTSIVMFIISILISILEIITHHHLSSSITNHYDKQLAYVPTAFYGNPNQLALILTLILLFLFAYFKTFKKEPNYLFYIMFVSAMVVTFFAQSVLNSILQLIILLLISINLKKFFKIFFLSIFFLSSFALLAITSDKLFNLKYIINGYLAGGSARIREALYLDAINSINSNFSLGYGINNSEFYYELLNDPRTKGIVNPHNYLLEMLINSGIYITGLYIILNIYISFLFLKNKQPYLVLVLFLYHIILISGSSALFGWYHYIFYIAIIALYFIKKTIYENNIPVKS